MPLSCCDSRMGGDLSLHHPQCALVFKGRKGSEEGYSFASFWEWKGVSRSRRFELTYIVLRSVIIKPYLTYS